MKFNAHIVHLTVRAADNDRVEFAGVEATDEFDAARKVAEWAAKRKYGDEGEAGWLSRDVLGGFLSCIGVGHHTQGGHILAGVTIEIQLTPV